MWQRFTERARMVILLAQEEAAKMNHEQVDTHHLLLGLVRQNEGLASQILSECNFSVERARREVENEVPRGKQPHLSEAKLSAPSKRALEVAGYEASRLRHNFIGASHLLLALLREKDSTAATIMGHLGIELERTRQQVIDYYGPQTGDEGRPAPPELKDWTNILIRQYWLPHHPANSPVPEALHALDAQWAQLTQQKEEAIYNDEYERAADLRGEAHEIEMEFAKLAREWVETQGS